MSLKVGETGKVLRVAAGFDMSSNTELTLTFHLPDGTTETKTTADGVALGPGVTDPILGALVAAEYVEYSVEPLLLSQAGSWNVTLTYENTTSTPTDLYIGNCASFTVGAAICP
jgi:hypothetical protein